MGMFDSLWVHCPACGARVEFQSKSGPRVLADYDLVAHLPPPKVAGDLHGDMATCVNGHLIHIIAQFTVSVGLGSIKTEGDDG